MHRPIRILSSLLIVLMAVALILDRAGAAQRSSPSWWDPDGVNVGADWHYRVPVTLSAGSSVNSTAKVDIDFASLMAQLGISGVLDINSIRVVRPGGNLASVQEYNDSIYADATDANASRGEVRWIVEDAGTQTYYVYFDVTANGSKASNPQTPINGNFEHSSAGTQLPSGWASAVKSNTLYDMQVTGLESPQISSDGNPLNNPQVTNGNPHSGSFAYLLGARTNNEPTSENNTTVLTRTFSVPSTNPGAFTINWRSEGWDSEVYDNLTITISNGTSTTTVVGNSLGLYSTVPNSPNIGGAFATDTAAGYGHYNGYDMTTTGGHLNGMSVALRSEQWWSRTVSLGAFAGQTVTLTISTNNTELYKTWFHLDDVAWSVVSGALGSAEGFGVSTTSPTGGQAPGQMLTLRASVDAKPTAAANPVTADIINASGSVVATGVNLFNDGTHGDAIANDAVWTNDGSDSASPTYTIPISSVSSSGWTVRIYARDASSSTAGSSFDGLVHRNGQPTALTMANWWNIDDATFSVEAAIITVAKSMTVIVNGVESANFKAIPGATLRYCVTIGNTGTATATTLIATDSLPSALSYVPGSLLSGADCANAGTVEDDDATGADESDPVGASYSGGTVSVTRPNLGAASSFAVTYQVSVN